MLCVTRAEPSKNGETDHPRLAEATMQKNPVDAYRGGNAPRATPAHVEGGFSVPPMAWGNYSPEPPARRRRDNNKEGTET